MGCSRGKRSVGRLVHERPSHAVPGYSPLFHAMGATEERKCPPLGCRIRVLALRMVTTACCATMRLCYSAVRQGR